MKLEDLQKITNAAQPTAGQGLTLDHNGLLPGTVLAPSPADLSLLQWNNTTKQAQWWSQSALPGYEFSYVEFTSNVSITATTAATAQTIVTAAAITFDGATSCIIEFFCPAAQPNSGVGSALTIELYDSATDICDIGEIMNPTASADYMPINLKRRLTPGNASHTYIVKGWLKAGGGTATMNAGVGTAGVLPPGFIRITRA